MSQSKLYYQLRHSCRALHRAGRGKVSFSKCREILEWMRVREYCRYHHCGLTDFGMAFDPYAHLLASRYRAAA